MSTDRFPMANRMVLDLLGPLVSARGTIYPRHLWALEGMMANLWRLDAEQQREWLRTVRAALHLLENGCNMHPHEIAQLVYDNFDQIGPGQMEIGELGKDVWSSEGSKEPDKRFRPVLDLYLTLYEKFYPLIVAPLIAADAMLRTKIPINQLVQDNGRAKHAAIEDLEEGRHYPRGLLTDGLNRHLRNSISHRHFTVNSLETITMEDRDPRTGQLSWGPVIYPYYDLREYVLQFLQTCNALVTTLIMFDVNNHDVLRERKFIKLKPLHMRLDIAELYLRSFAESYGFGLVSLKQPGFNTLEAILKITRPKEDQPAEIFIGGKGWAKKYVEDVRIEESGVRAQVYGLIQHTLDTHDQYEWLIIKILREDNSLAGSVKADRATRQIIFEGKKKMEEVRTLLAEDTLPDEKMSVVFREIPREA